MKELTQEQYAAIGRQKHIASVASGLSEKVSVAVEEFKFHFGMCSSSNIGCLDEAQEALERAAKFLPELKAALLERNVAYEHLNKLSGK